MAELIYLTVMVFGLAVAFRYRESLAKWLENKEHDPVTEERDKADRLVNIAREIEDLADERGRIENEE